VKTRKKRAHTHTTPLPTLNHTPHTHKKKGKPARAVLHTSIRGKRRAEGRRCGRRREKSWGRVKKKRGGEKSATPLSTPRAVLASINWGDGEEAGRRRKKKETPNKTGHRPGPVARGTSNERRNGRGRDGSARKQLVSAHDDRLPAKRRRTTHTHTQPAGGHPTRLTARARRFRRRLWKLLSLASVKKELLCRCLRSLVPLCVGCSAAAQLVFFWPFDGPFVCLFFWLYPHTCESGAWSFRGPFFFLFVSLSLRKFPRCNLA